MTRVYLPLGGRSLPGEKATGRYLDSPPLNRAPPQASLPLALRFPAVDCCVPAMEEWLRGAPTFHRSACHPSPTRGWECSPRECSPVDELQIRRRCRFGASLVATRAAAAARPAAALELAHRYATRPEQLESSTLWQRSLARRGAPLDLSLCHAACELGWARPSSAQKLRRWAPAHVAISQA